MDTIKNELLDAHHVIKTEGMDCSFRIATSQEREKILILIIDMVSEDEQRLFERQKEDQDGKIDSYLVFSKCQYLIHERGEEWFVLGIALDKYFLKNGSVNCGYTNFLYKSNKDISILEDTEFTNQ